MFFGPADEFVNANHFAIIGGYGAMTPALHRRRFCAVQV
jgi:hypothetical protein